MEECQQVSVFIKYNLELILFDFSDFDPNDIFKMFFGGGGPGASQGGGS